MRLNFSCPTPAKPRTQLLPSCATWTPRTLGNRTHFESHLVNTTELYDNLRAFAEAEPPVLLWQGNGRYECLFKFLAPRFLLAPDHVLDCERIHARWQWLCTGKRALRLPGLNATLRLAHYLENNLAFPSGRDLEPFLKAEIQEHRIALQALERDDEVALGWRTAFTFRVRFNLADNSLVDEDAPAAPAPAAAPGSGFALAWRSYMKTVFQPGFMYKVPGSSSIFLVLENKSLAGQEVRSHVGEASGRPLVVVFFEHLRGNLVQRTDRADLALKHRLLSLAELLRNLRVWTPPADPGRSAADTEALLERHYQDLEVVRFTKCVEPDEGVHIYSLESEVLAEVALVAELSPEHRTKMVLARCLERNDGLLPGESLQGAWGLPQPQLRARAASNLAPPVVPGAPGAPAPRARGRGGRGRGRGRG